jgi:hypothetical protein
MWRLVPLAVLAVTLASCHRGARSEGAEGGPLRLSTMPGDPDDRRRALVTLGETLHGALREARPEALLFEDDTLDDVLDPRSATRARASRAVGARVRAWPSEFALFAETTFAGICLQGARTEARDDTLGLRRRAWVFGRALVAARRPDGRRVAAWVEGNFVFTTHGFFAIGLERVEAPRWEHADLELAPCDMEALLR